MVKITAIVPAYNAAKTITETILSVQQQTFKEWELIVVNDGSTDDTLKVLNSIDESRLRIISIANAGVANARNVGIANARGEYIAFLDADDLWLADKLELQLKALIENSQAIVAYSWTTFMEEKLKGNIYSSSPHYQYRGNVYPRLLQGDFIHSGSNTLIRKQALDKVGGFDSDCNSCEDWDMWLRLAAIGDFTVIPKHQIIYRRAYGSATSNVEKMYDRAMFSVEKAYQSAPQNLQYLRKITEANLQMYIASLYLQHNVNYLQVKQAGKHLNWSIKKHYPILKNSFMQKMILKFLLFYLLPGTLGKDTFEKLRKIAT